MSDQPKPESDALLGDLESIRDLFDTKQQADEPVPVLDDVVEPTDDELPDLTIPDVAAGINSDLFDALLGDEWRDTAQKVLDSARDAINDNADRWEPTDTDDLNMALKVRIDETVQGWMRGIVIQNIATLHEELSQMLGNELPSMIDTIIAGRNATQPSNEHDG